MPKTGYVLSQSYDDRVDCRHLLEFPFFSSNLAQVLQAPPPKKIKR